MKPKLKEIIFQFMSDSISIKEFEQLVFLSIDEIQDIFSKDDYFVIIDFDFNDKFSEYELKKLIEKYIDIAEFHTWKIIKELKAIINKDEKIVDILLNIYSGYSGDYSFLDNLKNYGCSIGCYQEEPEYYNEDFIKATIYEDFEKIKEESETLLKSLEEKKIIIVDIDNFQDYR